MREEYNWRLPRAVVPLGKRTAIMAILNVTPDSFSDGGMYFNLDKAISRGAEIEQEGADIIDIGGESSRPGSDADIQAQMRAIDASQVQAQQSQAAVQSQQKTQAQPQAQVQAAAQAQAQPLLR